MIGAAVEHLPVLLDEVLKALQVRQEGVYVDCTLGLGGHSEQILSRLGGTGQLIALDWDDEALEEASDRLSGRHKNLQLLHESFRNLPQVLDGLQIRALDGCLLDLGVSSLQLDSPQRGFSFRREGPLDMRMDHRSETTAADLIDRLSEEELSDLFRRYGEEKAARRIAAAVVERRNTSPIHTTTDTSQYISLGNSFLIDSENRLFVTMAHQFDWPGEMTTKIWISNKWYLVKVKEKWINWDADIAIVQLITDKNIKLPRAG
ncbi:MAG: 16S rRNA (cytosine(1402)-N(4))-methyltransferase RsmH, partial [Acidobacteria bacterium]|nr:16S rRNA (cytosine(1402)-N(4))-methyltransferase RsmH [Acidobacteriota bacterium]